MPTHHEAANGAHVGASLDAYHAGSLSSEQAKAVKRHLLECPTCRQQSDDIALDRLVRDAPAPTVGPELRQRVFSAIVAERAAQSDFTRSGLINTRKRTNDTWTPLTSTAPARGSSRWASGLVAALIVALIAGVLIAAPRAGRQGQRHQTPLPAKSSAACPASKVSVALPKHASIENLAMTSPTEGWATGAITDGNYTATQALLLRFSECHWTQVALNLPGDRLGQISMDSPTDGWIIGQTDTATPVLLHYTNGAWSQAPLPDPLASARASAHAIKADSPGEVWMTAYPRKTVTGQTPAMLLMHRSNGVWTLVASPLADIFDMAPVGADDLWVDGVNLNPRDGSGQYAFAHYHNGGWDAIQPSLAATFTLHAVSPTDIWASGSAAIEHYDGSAWRDASLALPPTTTTDLLETYALGDGEGWAYQSAMSATPTSGPPVITISTLWRETGGQWQDLNLPYKDLSVIQAWAPVSDSEVWAIGGYQVIVPLPTRPGTSGVSSSFGYVQPVLLHYADGAWTRYG